MDLAGSPAVAELRAGPALALPAVTSRAALAAESSSTSAAATRTTTRTAEASTRTTATRATARSTLSAELSAFGTSGTARPAHHHEEVGLRVLRQALAQAARDLEGFAAVLAIHRWRGGCRGLRRIHLALQLRFKLRTAGLRAAHSSHALHHRRFLQLQRKVDLRGFRAIRFLAGRLEAEHAHFDGAIARRRAGERVVTALVRGSDEFPIADSGRDRRARNGLVRRLDEAALGIQPSAGGEKCKEKKTMVPQNFQVPQQATTPGGRQPLPVKTL